MTLTSAKRSGAVAFVAFSLASCFDPKSASTDADTAASDTVDTVVNGGFAKGTFADTVIRSSEVVLDQARSGSFRSRVFDGGEGAAWTRIEWTPLGPYGVALPDAGVQEHYLSGAADMRENILLVHADIAAPVVVGATLIDSSGRNNHPVVIGAPLEPAPGAFGGGFADTNASRLALDLATPRIAADFSFGTGDWTWMFWQQTSTPCTGNDSVANDVLMGANDDRTIGGEHVWFGCLRPTDPTCSALGAADSRLGGTLISVSGVADGGSYCGTRSITDGVRHHLVITKTGHAPATIETWIDGVKDFSGSLTFAAPFVWEDNRTWHIAGEPGARVSSGDFDEIAVFRRALSSAEIRQVYLRSVRKLTLRVRGCQAADCSDGEFGPPITDQGTSRGPDVSSEIAVVGRYFQYEMTFEGTLDDDGGPAVRRVAISRVLAR